MDASRAALGSSEVMAKPSKAAASAGNSQGCAQGPSRSGCDEESTICSSEVEDITSAFARMRVGPGPGISCGGTVAATTPESLDTATKFQPDRHEDDTTGDAGAYAEGGPGVKAGQDISVLKAWLTAVYSRRKPKDVHKIDRLLEKYKNNEQEMIDQIIRKYGHDGVRGPPGWVKTQPPAPSPTLSASPGMSTIPRATGSTVPGADEAEAGCEGVPVLPVTNSVPSVAPSTTNQASAAATGASTGVPVLAGEVADVTPITGDAHGTHASARQSGAEGKEDAEPHQGQTGFPLLREASVEVPAAKASPIFAVPGYSDPKMNHWKPSLQSSTPTKECIRRVRNDIRTLMRDPVPGLFVYPDENLVTVVHALVTGPFDTPYEGGFFYFVMHCPDDYPHNPPRVRLMTTGGGSVRFNPNFYSNGKVCLSILGTWNGPRWTPVQSISSILLSVQSLMTDKPYHNEPGYELASNPQDVRNYSDCITHETLRVAVCSMVQDSSLWRSMPECFQVLTRDLFLSFVPRYELVCEQNMHRDGEHMIDPFGHNKGVFYYALLLRAIKRLQRTLESTAKDEGSSEGTELTSTGRGRIVSASGSALDRTTAGCEAARPEDDGVCRRSHGVGMKAGTGSSSSERSPPFR